MAGIREDYIERLIEKLVAALAVLLKGGKAQRWEEVQEQLQQTSLSLFGLEYQMLVTVDAASVAALLEHPEKIKALARLLSAEAELLQRRGELPGAVDRWEHALELLEEARRRRATPDGEGEVLRREVRERLSELGAHG
jgi:ABC-type transporter Mla MlaB component